MRFRPIQSRSRGINRETGNETQNETQNETAQNFESLDIYDYVNHMQNTFDPTRPRDNKNLAFQLSQINEYLGGLVE